MGEEEFESLQMNYNYYYCTDSVGEIGTLKRVGVITVNPQSVPQPSTVDQLFARLFGCIIEFLDYSRVLFALPLTSKPMADFRRIGLWSLRR